MKRSSSEQSFSDDEDIKPQIELPVTPKKPKVKAKLTSASPASPENKQEKRGRGGGQVNGEWTPEKKAEYLDAIIANGYKATDLDELSHKVSICIAVCYTPFADIYSLGWQKDSLSTNWYQTRRGLVGKRQFKLFEGRSEQDTASHGRGHSSTSILV